MLSRSSLLTQGAWISPLAFCLTFLLIGPAPSTFAAPQSVGESQEQRNLFIKRNELYKRAQAAVDSENYKEARELLNQTLEITRQIRPAGHNDIIHLLESLALAYVKLDDMPAAITTCREIVDIKKKDLKEGSWQYFDLLWTVRHMEIMASLTPEQRDELFRAEQLAQEARNALARGDSATGEKRMLEILEIRKSIITVPHPLIFTALTDLGSFYLERGETEKATERFREAVALGEAHYNKEQCPDGHVHLATAYVFLGRALAAQGNLAKGRELLEYALKMREKLFPRDEFPNGHLHMATNLGALSGVAEEQGDLAAARTYLERSADAYIQLYPEDEYPDSHEFVISALNSIGTFLTNHGETEAAKPYYERALELSEKLFTRIKFPQGHVHYADALFGLARILYEKNNFVEVEPLLRQAVPMYLNHSPQGSRNLFLALDYLANSLFEQSRYQEAGKYFENAMAVAERIYPETQFPQGHPNKIQVLRRLADVQSQLGNQAAANQFIERASAMTNQLYPEEEFPGGHLGMANISTDQALQLMDSEPEKAKQLLEQSLTILEKSYPQEEFPDGHHQIAAAFFYLALAHQTLGDDEGTLAYSRRAEAMLEKLYPADKFPQGNALLASVYSNIASVFSSREDHETALDYYTRGYEMRTRLYPQEMYPDGHSETAKSLSNLGREYEFQENYSEATAYFKQALTAWDNLYPIEQYPKGNERLALALRDMGRVFLKTNDLVSALPFLKRGLVMFQRLYPQNEYPHGHYNLAESFNLVGETLRLLGQQEEARDHFQQAVAILDSLHPEGGYLYDALVIRNLGLSEFHLGNLPAAGQHLARAARVYEAQLSPDENPHGSIDLADCLLDLGFLRERERNFSEALVVLDRAEAMYDALLSEPTVTQAGTLLALIRVSTALGDISQTEERLAKVDAMLEALFPSEEFPQGHEEIAKHIDRWGELFANRGDHEAAEEQHSRALDMRQALYPAEEFPKGHDELVTSFLHLGTALHKQGNFAESIDYFQQIVDMHEQLYPLATHPRGRLNRVLDLVRLGDAYQAAEEFAAAEDCYQQGLALYEEFYTPARYPDSHPDVATAYNRMGDVLLWQGKYKEALGYYERSVNLWEFFCSPERYPKGHPYLAITYSRMGYLLHALGQAERAEGYYQQAQAMLETIYSREQYPGGHAYWAEAANSLGHWHQSQAHLEEARRYYASALKIYEGLAHGTYGNANHACTLNNLVHLHFAAGDYPSAQQYAQESFAIYQRLYPPERLPQGHHALALCSRNLAELEIAAGDPKAGYAQLVDAFWTQFGLSQDVITSTPDPTIRSRTQSLRGPHDALLTLCWIYRNDVPTATADALQAVVAHKTIVADTARRLGVRDGLKQNDPQFAETLRHFRPLDRQLLARATPVTDESEEDLFARLQTVADERNQLHEQLTAQVDAAAGASPPLKLDLSELRQRLPQNSAVVEFVRMTPYVFKAHKNQPAWRTPRYVAFVLTSESETPQLVDLGPAQPLEDAIAAVTKHLQDASTGSSDADEATLEADYRELASTLQTLVFAPLVSTVGEAKLVFIAPHQDLNRINFEALVDEQGQYLIENYDFAYLSSSRDLLRQPEEAATGTVVFSAPKFGFGQDLASAGARSIAGGAAAVSPQPEASPDTLDAIPLQWSSTATRLDEVAVLEQTIKSNAESSPVVELINQDATEEAFTALEPSGVIHISAPAFQPAEPDTTLDEQPFIDWDQGDIFLPNDPTDRKLPPTIAARISPSRQTVAPLYSSGIGLAGADRATLANDPQPPSTNDGLLTADEISTAHLRKTKLVTLHLWDNAPTATTSNTAIESLRYAFLQAGSRAFVTNTLAMPDDVTQEFLTEFYSHISAGTSPQQALREAKLSLLSQRRDASQAAHPMHWAGFILSGQGR